MNASDKKPDAAALRTRAESAEAKLKCADDVFTRHSYMIGPKAGDELVANVVKLFDRAETAERERDKLMESYRFAADECMRFAKEADQLRACVVELQKDAERVSLLEWLGESAFFPDWADNGFWQAKVNRQRVIGTTLRQFCDAAIAARVAQGEGGK